MSGLIDLKPNQHHQDLPLSGAEPVEFHGNYVGHMDMYADVETVSAYLDGHDAWFRRCAQPMTAEPLGNNGYALLIGHFGALGYEVEPKVGLHLLPQDHGVYRIQTIPIPGYTAQGYDVDFQASMNLLEVNRPDEGISPVTQVEWELKLSVWVQFPRFIQSLPRPLVKGTGDRLLTEIVRQVSKRLTRKVQEDFHTSMNLPMPQKPRKPWGRFAEAASFNPSENQTESN